MLDLIFRRCDDRFSDQRQRPALSLSATITKDGSIFISLINIDLERSFAVECRMINALHKIRSIRLLSAEDPREHNSFDLPHAITPREVEPSGDEVIQVPPLR
jgi:alpha-L-arabinofuranosidase